jgi:pimeloyl-ACP methyl ester carboxylesterase
MSGRAGLSLVGGESGLCRRRAIPPVHLAEMPKGGHFAAMEQPEALAGEIQSFFRPLR